MPRGRVSVPPPQGRAVAPLVVARAVIGRAPTSTSTGGTPIGLLLALTYAGATATGNPYRPRAYTSSL